jgi:hypothetical protein
LGVERKRSLNAPGRSAAKTAVINSGVKVSSCFGEMAKGMLSASLQPRRSARNTLGNRVVEGDFRIAQRIAEIHLLASRH